MAIYETKLDRECLDCDEAAEFILVSDDGEREDPIFLCGECVHEYDDSPKQEYPEPKDKGEGPDREPLITVATEYEGSNVKDMCCTYTPDGGAYCGERPAAVFVLVDGRWHFDCLCSEHVGKLSRASDPKKSLFHLARGERND
jgi:hypothetical protein